MYEAFVFLSACSPIMYDFYRIIKNPPHSRQEQRGCLWHFLAKHTEEFT